MLALNKLEMTSSSGICLHNTGVKNRQAKGSQQKGIHHEWCVQTLTNKSFSS
jgi:hypothetical protein